MDTIQKLFRPEDLSRLENKIKRERAWIFGLAGATLALCVLCCCLTTTANAEQMELAAVSISTVGGWLVIYRRLFGLQETRYELQHAQYLSQEHEELLRGRLTITKERMRIKSSIRFRVLLLEGGGETRRLKVDESRVKALKPWDGETVTVALAGGYVAGIGGSHADP